MEQKTKNKEQKENLYYNGVIHPIQMLKLE